MHIQSREDEPEIECRLFRPPKTGSQPAYFSISIKGSVFSSVTVYGVYWYYITLYMIWQYDMSFIPYDIDFKVGNIV
jgi:hypothetical protein